MNFPLGERTSKAWGLFTLKEDSMSDRSISASQKLPPPEIIAAATISNFSVMLTAGILSFGMFVVGACLGAGMSTRKL